MLFRTFKSMLEQSSEVESEKWMETHYIRIRREGDILHCIFVNCPNMNLEIAKHIVQQRKAVAAGKSYPCLVDMREILSATQDSRDYFANEGAEGVKAGALLIGSQVTKMLANLFMIINRPKTPTKMFTNEKAAREWLKKFI